MKLFNIVHGWGGGTGGGRGGSDVEVYKVSLASVEDCDVVPVNLDVLPALVVLDN